MKRSLILMPICFLLATGCATRDEIARRELLNELSDNMNQAQKLNAETVLRLGDIEERIGLVSGKIEEGQQKDRQSYISNMEKIQTEMNQLKHQLSTLEESYRKDLKDIKQTQEAQKKYLEDVLAALAKVSGEKKSNKKDQSVKNQSVFDQAMESFDKGDLKDARPLHEELVNDQKLKANQRARVLHNLGIISFKEKKYDDALTYLSKLYTEHSSSSFAPNGLLHLGKSFESMNKKAEAKQAWQELLVKYPQSKHAGTAKKLLKE